MIIAGVDEAGRGPLAGPVVAAAAVLTREQSERLLSSGLADSKKLTPARRERIFREIQAIGVPWKAQAASPLRIDRMNILQASLWAMERSVRSLGVYFDIVIVDGSFTIPGLEFSQKAMPKADSNIPEVAAASVCAKVLRDRAMTAMDRLFPGYGFASHKGYPTKAHFEALKELGPSRIHRKSFNLHC
jgi:ribonuclease HII